MAPSMMGDEPFEDDEFSVPKRSEIEADRSGDPLLEDFTTDDLEAAYLRALESMESEDWVVGPDTDPHSDDSESEVDSDEPREDSVASETAELSRSAQAADVRLEIGQDQAGASRVKPESDETALLRANSASGEVEVAGADFLGGISDECSVSEHSAKVATTPEDRQPRPDFAGKSTGQVSTRNGEPGLRDPETSQPPPNATRIIEACLFVGGQPLSAKRLGTLLESTADSSFVENLVDELNLEYASQQRPYEIRLGDGGYRIALRTEFEVVRNRVYGVGPRDVKLSQDVLEVLALVAYQQPIAHSAVEACGKANVANILRQLLRRELITLVRIDQSRKGVEYRTSGRFLQVFGLGNLNELPRPEDLAMR